MTAVVDLELRSRTSGPAAGGAARRTWLTDRRAAGLVALLAIAAAVARLPFLTRPLSPDEGGFLMVARQWAPGTSLYGDYWVDRPPMLVLCFRLADLVGGSAIALRLLGVAWVVVSVLLAAALGRAAARLTGVAPHRARLAPVLAAAATAPFLVSPLFGASEVDGELLAVPFVLAGITAVLRASTARPRRSALWWGLAGALGVTAAAVKQNMLEVFVVAVVVLLATARRAPARTGRSAAAFMGGAATAVATLLAVSAWHGTSPAALWDAVVMFRFEASDAIARSAPSTTHLRAFGVAGAFLASGGLVLVVATLAPSPRRLALRAPSLLGVAAAATLSWELLGVLAGGSYWLHYLVGTVPGLVLATVAATLHGGVRRQVVVAAVLVYAALVATGAVAARALSPVGTPPEDLAVERYLAAHAHPGDSGVVGFGDPALLQAAHLSSPYPELWSLPVRVRDPQLTELTRVLEGPSRPDWVVVDGDSLETWGVDASSAQPVLEREYVEAVAFGDWHVFHLRADG